MSISDQPQHDFRKQKDLSQLARCIGMDAALLDQAAQRDKSELLIGTEEAGFLINKMIDEEGEHELFSRINRDGISSLNIPKVSKSCLFQKHLIPKRHPSNDETHRIVWEARSPLAECYKSFTKKFDIFTKAVEPLYPHAASYGYVRGKNTIDNASPHCGAKLILHADIRRFFPSITFDRIKSLFLLLDIQEAAAEILAYFTTIENTLPLGLHSSPLLSNILCLQLDDKFSQLAHEYDCQYTRYADDITISGNRHVPDKADVNKILQSEGFSLSERKFRITKPGQAHYVTGLSVTDSKPRAPRAMKKRLRQELYYCEKYGIRNHLTKIDGRNTNYLQHGINRIDGMVRYVSYIEDIKKAKTRDGWAAMLRNEKLGASYPSRLESEVCILIYYIDETEVEFKEQKYLALCMTEVTLDENEKIKTLIDLTLDDYHADDFSGGDKAAIKKRGLHWQEANQDLKRKFCDSLSLQSFKAYISYTKITNNADYENAYIALLNALLPRRLMACDNSIVVFEFEQNSKVSKTAIEQAVFFANERLCETNNRHPRRNGIKIIGKKESLCIAVPDAVLGIFREYACLNDGGPLRKPIERSTLFFNRISHNIRLILDAESNMVYTRKRPFMPWE